MLKALGISGIIFLSAVAANAQAAPDASAFLSKVNQNNDKTLSIREANAYAAKKFQELNAKGTRTLSRQELAGRISDADFNAANTEHRKDQTLSKSEFISYVDHLFRQANTKGGKTLSVDELGSPAGQKLMILLQ